MEQNSQFNPLCDRLAQVIGGKGKAEEGVCVITVKRKDIQASIAGVPYHSLAHMFHLEMPSINSESLITGEMALLENEVPDMVNHLTNSGPVTRVKPEEG